jgi:hypothetical protein
VVVVVIVVVVVGDGKVSVDDVSVVGNGVVESEVVVVVVVVVVMVVSGFAGERITNFNSSERVTAIITKMIKEMDMIHRRCRHLDRL